ncbi:MAG: hypothetical protein [Microviridae sp.]|nr:MAG: hypothetical protein [Microviridae sp.]
MLNKRGQEVPDPTPVEIPAGLRKPESMEDMIRRFVRVEGTRVAESQGMESFEEANDFELESTELDELPTPYDVPEMVDELSPDGTHETLDGASGTVETEPAGTLSAQQPQGEEGESNSPLNQPGSGGGTPPAPGGASDASQT